MNLQRYKYRVSWGEMEQKMHFAEYFYVFYVNSLAFSHMNNVLWTILQLSVRALFATPFFYLPYFYFLIPYFLLHTPVVSDFRDGRKWGVLPHPRGKTPQAVGQESPGSYGKTPRVIGQG